MNDAAWRDVWKDSNVRFGWLRRWRVPTPWYVRWFGEIEWRVRKALR